MTFSNEEQLDEEVDATLRELRRRRSAKLTLVIVGMVLGGVAAVAATALMYSDTTHAIGSDRIGSGATK